MKYKLLEINDDEETVTDVELTKYEFGQALVMHKRMAQRKER